VLSRLGHKPTAEDGLGDAAHSAASQRPVCYAQRLRGFFQPGVSSGARPSVAGSACREADAHRRITRRRGLPLQTPKLLPGCSVLGRRFDVIHYPVTDCALGLPQTESKVLHSRDEQASAYGAELLGG
jgi:hypothetical protein